MSDKAKRVENRIAERKAAKLKADLKRKENHAINAAPEKAKRKRPDKY